ncbi:hypothetical protein EHRUM1_09890 [Ehrlichia ruminantium]|uniref:Uncharacterized protein n=1 Tax=Ehrlichia ruminantium (strain Welgevonden) TaxID=254945 RepID=A0A0H3M065_EHRRW|nr:hypothetical protein [Ehrlichia ruminantium]QLK51959.1 hypothetical protein FDZ65_00190 [Ehrlichia ruminantium]QLK53791.1 hypothetical protein FDZ63_00190 [Ehrlichia ruminantium]QLK54704.1 hypothetical protein FDZ62_00190 [Ehrlichia ruminantium]QLK55623.1 hypothetical protein FDZ61_00190 [Ehrlichia ruminantium]QLK56544.1 hypothetical protein FDZ60_00190 [Ehrlichia ruminantium]
MPEIPFINNKNDVKSTKITWEIVKNQKYKQTYLLQVSCLYIITVYPKDYDISLPLDNPIGNILLRINTTMESVLLNKLLNIEILKGISSHKFISKKKNNIARLQDISQFFSTNFNVKLPKNIEESFIAEHKEAAQLLKSSINI